MKNILFLIMANISLPSIGQVYVDASATGSNNGSSWANAYTDLPAAITATSTGEIWVAAGTYYPTSSTDQNISFEMKNNVEIYGGFAGTETLLSQRDFRTNITILSGDIGVQGDDSDNSYHVFNNNLVDNTAVLDGFRITGGRTNSGGSGGGGMLNTNADVVVQNCTFIDNKTFLSGSHLSPQNHGGAVYNITSAPTFINCVFQDNESNTYGGAIYGWASAGFPQTKIYNCVFDGNHARFQGGAIAGFSVDYAIINTTIYGNSAVSAGGGILAGSSAADYVLTGTILWGNTISTGSNQATGNVVWNVTSSIIEGGILGAQNTDPLFTDPANGDFSFEHCSPAVNAGDNIISSLGVTEDILGNTRVIDGTADIGAYEYQQVITPLSLTSTPVNASCNGASDGEIALSYSGGLAPLEVFLDGVSQGTATFLPNLSAGTYMVKIVDNGGCEISESVSVGEPSQLFAGNRNVNEISCAGAADAFIELFPVGGTTPYEYSIDGGANYQASHQFSNVGPGSHEIFIRDANGCEVAGVVLNLNDPTAVDAFAFTTVTNITCNGDADGEIVVNSVVGNPPIEYSIDGGANYQTSTSFQGLTPGNYTINIRDNNGCMGSVSGTVTEPAQLVLTASVGANVLCKGDATGQILVGGAGGTAPLEFSKDGINFFQLSQFNNLAADSYTITLRDANGCTDQATLTVTEPTNALGTTLTVTDANCSGNNDGMVSAASTGGTGPFTYSLDGVNFQSSGFFDNLNAASYTLTTMDANGCTVITPFQVNEPDALSATAISSDISCNGLADGSISSTVTGGTLPYTYSLDNVNFQSSPLFENLAPGSNTYYVQDANGCTTSFNASISEPSQLSATVSGVDNTCNGEAEGSITATGTGGTAPYEYSLDGNAFFSSGQFTSLAAGSYTVSIRDANGCSIQQNASITEPDLISTTSTTQAASCFGGTDGSFSVSSTGGNGPYDYSIDGTNFQTQATFSGLGAGSYTLTSRDANGCSIQQSVSISEPDELMASSTPSGASCTGESDGSITTSVSGGTSPYMYSIDGVNFQSEATFNNLSPGSYTVYITDANGCSSENAVTVTEPDQLMIAAAMSVNGVVISARGGTAPYQYSADGSTFQNEETFLLPNGSYTFTVRDANGCEESITEAFTVTGIHDVSVEVYPNPASSQLLFSGLTGDETLVIYNTLGQLVRNQKLRIDEAVDIQSIGRGILLVEIHRPDGTAVKTKIVKQ